jgi:tRNA nucleotidyltransferase (CCA-adding enzyme)
MEVLTRLKERGFEAYLVGGCVRDMVRGAAPKDFDLATSARPEEVQQAFPKTLPTGIQHGTVTVLSRGTPVEVTTFRSEGAYLDARRPSSVTFHTEITADLSRRDFTINAMALDPTDGRIVDPFGGRADLEARIIRCVGTPEARFGEDGLRALRAVRFAAVLGFALDEATEAAIPATLPSFRKIAQERIREEFTRLLLSARPREGLELLRRTGLLGAFVPEVAAGDDASFSATAEAVARAPAELELRLSVLLHAQPPADVPAILLRLRYPGRTVQTVGALVRELRRDPRAPSTDADLRRLAARLGRPLVDPYFTASVALHGEPVVGPSRDRLRALLEANPPLEPRALALNGGGIMEILGVGPSPIVGEATRFLMEQVLEDPALNSSAELEKNLRSWAEKGGR